MTHIRVINTRTDGRTDEQLHYGFTEPAMTECILHRRTLEFVRTSAAPRCSDNCEMRTALDVRLSKPLTPFTARCNMVSYQTHFSLHCSGTAQGHLYNKALLLRFNLKRKPTRFNTQHVDAVVTAATVSVLPTAIT